MKSIAIEAGLLAGIVHDVNSGDGPDEPYEKGCTVFYWEQRVVKIRGFHLVPTQFVMAWQEAEQ